MKNKKGFTLIELLAVIVVLAIIALIATPIVMNTIKNAKKGAAERSADNYIKQVETAVAEAKLEKKSIPNGTYDIDKDGNLTGEGLPDGKLEIDMSGTKPSSGTVTISNGEVSQDGTKLVVGDYNVIYNDDKCTATKIETYKITYKLTNVSGDNAISITNIEDKSLVFTANEGYKLPLSVTVDGATSTWDKKTGTLILSKVTGNVTITLNGIVKTMCNAVDTATKGNVPQGQFAYGDEYICDLGDTDDSKNLTFFVLEDGDTTTLTDGRIAQAGEVSLIMNKNLGKAVAWVTKEDYLAAGGTESDYGTYGNNSLGPITASKILEERTTNWTKLDDKSKITLPTYQQLKKVYTRNLSWLIAGIGKYSSTVYYSQYGYWTSTASSTSVSGSWTMFYDDSIKEYYIGSISVYRSSYYGIRPVITISKSNLS